MRPTLTEHPDGIYRPLDVQIAERMRPVEAKRDGWFWLRVAGYGMVTVLTGLGFLILLRRKTSAFRPGI